MAVGGASWVRERVRGWGMAVGGEAEVCRPETKEQVAEALGSVTNGAGVVLRGSGCSYGDAANNTGGHVLDLSRMNRILAFDPATGIARVEPGVRIRDLWRHAIPHGFWPAVVPGTMAVSMGGAAAMNIHGKNAFAVGTFGEHVQSFVLRTPGGEELVCDRERHADVFHAAISGFGMLGAFTELTVKLKKVHSGRLRVWGIPMRSLEDGLAILEDCKGDADYLVGWCDLWARGSAYGRGVMHRADQLAPGEDPEGERLLTPERQDVPGTLFGVVPKGWIWPGMWCAFHFGMVGFVNALEVPGRLRRGPQIAVPADARGVPLPARLRAAVAMDGEAGRADPVPAVRAGGRGVAGVAAGGGDGAGGGYAALPRGAEAPPARSVPDDARPRRLLDGDGLRRAGVEARAREALASDAGDGRGRARRRRPLLLREGRDLARLLVRARARLGGDRGVPRPEGPPGSEQRPAERPVPAPRRGEADNHAGCGCLPSSVLTARCGPRVRRSRRARRAVRTTARMPGRR